MTAAATALPTAQLLEELGGVGVLEEQAVEALARFAKMPVAVACSGGPDSVAVALITRALHDGPLTLLHYNHKLRGEGSDGDAAFVRELAAKLGCDFREGEWDAPSAQNETAAREARLGWLHRWEYAPIVFGQHADDAAETLLMRLARGASAEGLTAPHPVREHGSHLHLRPLLSLRKAAIVAALEKLGVAYRTDPTNGQSDYLRNKIRNELLPLWQSFEPQRDVVGGILRSREQLLDDVELSAAATCEESEASLSAWPSVSLPLGTTVFLPCGLAVSASEVDAPSVESLRENSNTLERVWVRADVPLSLAMWQPGQRYQPLGSPGSRKVKAILSESVGAQVSSMLRAIWPVVMGGDEYFWLPGARITLAAALEPKQTRAVELRFGSKLATLKPDA